MFYEVKKAEKVVQRANTLEEAVEVLKAKGGDKIFNSFGVEVRWVEEAPKGKKKPEGRGDKDGGEK